MSHALVRFDVKLQLRAPVLTRAAGTVGIGIDVGMLRDPTGLPAFHYTHIKGKLRDAWCTLQQLTGAPDNAFIAGWLGDRSKDEFAPERGALGFDAYWTAAHPPNSPHRYRVRIDEATGTVAQGALMVIESPWPSGLLVTFSGAIHARVNSHERAELLRWLHAGFNLVPAFGALQGNGFGRLQRAQVCAQGIAGKTQRLPADIAAATRVGLRIHPLDPFCFARPATGNQNHFAAEPCIPGAALIAAIAARCRLNPTRFPKLKDALDLERSGAPVRLVLSEARPVQQHAKRRPITLPLSLVHLPGGFHDLLRQTTPGLVNGALPIFQVDWKDQQWDAASTLFNPDAALPETRLLIRTAIDPDTRTSAENKLFSMETVLPGNNCWLANLELRRCADPATILSELADLLAEPLTHLGKTKARASVEIQAAFAPSVVARPTRDDTAVLVLQTPAALLPDDFCAASTGAGSALHAAYADTWRKLSHNSLDLMRFFAAQRLYGGAHWWSRYQPGGCYRPRLLTTPGSVFLLRLKQPSAARLLADWQHDGLPQPPGVRGGEDWQRNPWIAANGYGEILLDPDIASLLAKVASTETKP
jgi:hypothetical protein